jgi:ACT domain-containing protein
MEQLSTGETRMSEQQEQSVTSQKYISMDDAARELNVNRSTVYYYLEQLEIKPTKFPLDRRAYLALTDLERIKAAKKSAAERKH